MMNRLSTPTARIRNGMTCAWVVDARYWPGQQAITMRSSLELQTENRRCLAALLTSMMMSVDHMPNALQRPGQPPRRQALLAQLHTSISHQ